ncbi:MAG TPA: tRNA uridine-5-carboxymethylaminomethyl(34) synthesis GTPase MnmE [Candidatus Azoamicus sp. OHIO2]
MINNLHDTIVAISTPKGKGGIGIIRISGIKSYIILEHIVKKKIPERLATYCNFFDCNNTIIDNGLVLFFRKPKSFTGEDIVEFHAHGNNLMLETLVSRIIELGARIAEPGEFSFRAYINNKIDILQAESINSLINSKNINQSKLIINTLLGQLSQEIKVIANDLFLLRCEIEASIDFPTDVHFNEERLITNIIFINEKINKLLKKIKLDTISLEEIKIIIIGDTNVGKSSFFNFLLKKDRSIITPTAGTTRDFIEDTLILDNKVFHLIDTAGLNKHTGCKIEKNGILKTFEQIKTSNIIIFIFDITNNNLNEHDKIIAMIINKFKKKVKILILKNKIDLLNITTTIVKHDNYNEHYISIKKKLGLLPVLNELISIYNDNNSYKYSMNKRHFNLLKKSKNEINILKYYLKNKIEPIIVAEKLKNAYLFLTYILGENLPNRLIEKIFSNFCIGK